MLFAFLSMVTFPRSYIDNELQILEQSASAAMPKRLWTHSHYYRHSMIHIRVKKKEERLVSTKKKIKKKIANIGSIFELSLWKPKCFISGARSHLCQPAVCIRVYVLSSDRQEGAFLARNSECLFLGELRYSLSSIDYRNLPIFV